MSDVPGNPGYACARVGRRNTRHGERLVVRTDGPCYLVSVPGDSLADIDEGRDRMGGDRWGREEILALLERERMVSLLNDTRWMRLIEGLRDLPLHYRVKVLTEDEVWDAGGHLFLPVPEHAYIEGGLMGPVPARAIEWLEIEPIERR